MKNLKYIGIRLIVGSFLFWIIIPIVTVLPLTLTAKGILTGIILVVAEVMFWSGGLIVGKEILKKFNLFERLYLLINNKLSK
ncbi:MAG: transporter suffix domain-containing protein [Clostridiaceae bacterium]